MTGSDFEPPGHIVITLRAIAWRDTSRVSVERGPAFLELEILDELDGDGTEEEHERAA